MSDDDICRLSDELRLVLSLAFKQFVICTDHVIEMVAHWDVSAKSNLSIRVEFEQCCCWFLGRDSMQSGGDS